ncbi:MAG: histidine kinase [Flavobacteriaceae bacterium]|nr:histidine kinase [Flavobacteriaceae bacterium]
MVTSMFSQIIDLDRDMPYKKVFVETDNFGASYLNTLEENFTKINSDTIQFSMLNDLSYYWHTRNLNTAYNFTKKGLELTKEKNNRLWNGRFQITQGSILLRMEKLDSALIVLHSASAKVKQKDLPFLYTQLGYVYERKGKLDKAVNYVLVSLKLGNELNDKKAIALAYSDLSNIFWKQSKFEKGLEYGLKSLQVFEERRINDLDYDFTLYIVGNNYLELKKYEKAIQYFDHAIAIGERYGFYNNLSDVYISQVDLYAYLNEFNKARIAGDNALKYAELLDNNFMMMRALLSIGKLQVLEGKYISAIRNLKKCIDVATADFGDEFYLSQAYQSLGKAYAGNHNYKDAYIAFAEYDKLKNLIFTAEADLRISLLQTEFDVAQKETTILNQGNQLKKQKTRQTLITIITSLLLLILLLLLFTYRNNRKKSRLLQKQNEEKEFLLKEIHHRVKNNLGVVSSLLELQTAQIDDPKIKEIMAKSQNRVYSMSMIHQKLYQGKNLAFIEMKDYFKDLGNHILDSFGANNEVKMIYEMKKIELDVDTAIPLGLIVNELLTNAFKYAFPNKTKGIIRIGLVEINSQVYELKVIDNGIGLNEPELKQNTGFGIQLITLLTKQLDGVIEKINDNGTTIKITFKSTKSIIDK